MISLFPCNIHEIKVRNFKIVRDDILKYIYQERKKTPGVVKSNVGGWQSPSLYSTFDNILISTVKKEVEDYFSIHRVFREGVRIEFLNMWININKKTNHNATHIHPGAHLAGVWWIKVPENSGKLYINSPHWFNQYYEMSSYSDEFRKGTNSHPDFYMNPYDGGMIIFPASLYHTVRENKSDKDRISVSFNINLWPPDK